MRTERLSTSTPQLDAAEEEWWDRFSPVSERVWALDPELSAALRTGYLDRAAAWFQAGATTGRVLDLGCGSGLISRHFASAGIAVLGVDVSGEQIQQASALAEGDPNSSLMEFRVSDAAEIWSSGERFDGVVAHAFLHHLAEDELELALAGTRGILGPGGRAWFYEPVFFRDGRRGPSAIVAGGFRRAISGWGGLARSRGRSDDAMIERVNAFQEEADEKGYFLSPKEVPFQPDELIEALSAHFELERIRWENTGSYQLASSLSVTETSRPRLRSGIVRAAARIDAAFGGRGNLDRYRGLNGYGFASAFCSVPDD